MLNKKERIEFLEQDYFFEIANDAVADLEREHSFIDYELLESELNNYINALIYKNSETIKKQGLSINNWHDLLTSKLLFRNDLVDDLAHDCCKFISEEIYNMLVVYTESIKDEVLFWKNAR